MSVLAAERVGVERGARWILRDVSLRLDPGAALGLVGPNGSGKSTLLRTMAGLWRASEGGIALDGRPLDALDRAEIARGVAYVPQEARFEFEFTVRDVVKMGRYPHRGRFAREAPEDREAAEDAMARADVAHLADRRVTELSGGERQRVLIARSLATRARVLLLDEPTANLDVEHALDVLELCRALVREGQAIAIATHDLNAVLRYTDRAALLDSGSLIGLGSPESVLTAENLERAFHVRSEIVAAPDGAPMLTFRRRG
jgi:iron complex transport system ATP-binding protein